jgi:hypothetical protein
MPSDVAFIGLTVPSAAAMDGSFRSRARIRSRPPSSPPFLSLRGEKRNHGEEGKADDQWRLACIYLYRLLGADGPDEGHDTVQLCKPGTASVWAGQHQRLHRRSSDRRNHLSTCNRNTHVLFLGAANSGICFYLEDATTTRFKFFTSCKRVHMDTW